MATTDVLQHGCPSFLPLVSPLLAVVQGCQRPLGVYGKRNEVCAIKKKVKILFFMVLFHHIRNCVFGEDVYILIHIQHHVAITR